MTAPSAPGLAAVLAAHVGWPIEGICSCSWRWRDDTDLPEEAQAAFTRHLEAAVLAWLTERLGAADVVAAARLAAHHTIQGAYDAGDATLAAAVEALTREVNRRG